MRRYLRTSPNRIDRPAPLVAVLFRRMISEQVTNTEVERQSGISRQTLARWGTRRAVPNVENLEACLNVVGMTLIAVPLELAPKTRSVSAKHELVEWLTSILKPEEPHMNITYPVSYVVTHDRVSIIDAGLWPVTEILPAQVPQYKLNGAAGNYVPTVEDKIAIAKTMVDALNASANGASK